jgi:ribonucleoside-diphosphate reductase alpha subunit
MYNRMRVLKRSGSYEDVSFDKILNRIRSLCFSEEFENGLNIDETILAQKVVQEIYDGVKTSELDDLSAQNAMSLYSTHPDFKILAGRITVSNLHKNTLNNFSDKIELMYNHVSNGIKKPLIGDYLYKLVQENKSIINDAIDYSKDYNYDFFGLKTLEKTYLYKIDKKIVERPQDMLMRVSLSIHRDNLEKALENYRMMSDHYFTHATPTLYNAGSRREQFASCFLLTMQEDSISGIYKTLGDCAMISKHAGGIGLSIHDIRGTDSYIAGTNGHSNGLVPMLRVFNDTARYVDQGGGKRNGSFAIYLEPWHCDIFEFIELKKNHGNESERARDLFYALWIPDLFMERVKNNEQWSLMCPNECKGLSDVWGEEFNTLYSKYETEKKYRKQIDARTLWQSILTCQIETGNPYLLYKDSCNKKSNQQNLGTIKSSNLCTEIIEYTSPEETAVCNLASIALKKFVVQKDTNNLELVIYSKSDCVYCQLAEGLCKKKNISYEKKHFTDLTSLSGTYPLGVKFPQIYIKKQYGQDHLGGYTELEEYVRPTYDYEKLRVVTKKLTHNLNNIIDYNYYPTKETKRSNLRHRPIGLGVQGLANVFLEFGYSFDSSEARELNDRIFECIYFSSLEASMEISRDREEIIKKYKQGLKQLETGFVCNGEEFVTSGEIHDIKKNYNIISEELDRDEYLGTYSSYIGSPMYQGKLQFDLWRKNVTDIHWNWSELRDKIKRYGVRNSLLVAPMPTASTAQILGNYECFEPIMSNIYSRRVLAGEYMIMNDYLVEDLISLNLWSKELKDKLILNDGSIQSIKGIPQKIKDKYKTIWEIKQKVIVDMALDRGKFICQSQSMNLFLESPNISTLTSMHFYGWEKGLKTGIYYLRSRPSSKAIQFTIEPDCVNCSG